MTFTRYLDPSLWPIFDRKISSGPPAFIQSGSDVHVGAPEEVTVVLPAPPTPGNLLIASFGVRGTGASLAVTRAGWTVQAATLNPPATDGMQMAYRIAAPGDPASMLFGMGAGCSGQNRGSVAEFANVSLLNQTVLATGNSNAPTANIDPTDGPNTLLIAAAIQTNAGAGNDYTPQNGETEIVDAVCQGGFGPANWLAYRIIPNAVGPYTLGAITVGAGGWAIRIDAFQ